MSYEITFGGRFQAGLGITTGKVVVKAGSLYLPATTANVALYPIAGLVVRYQQVPSANYDVGDIAHAGVWPSSLTGLTAATAGVATYARVTSTGSLESTTAPVDGDQLMGRINSDGDLMLSHEIYAVAPNTTGPYVIKTFEDYGAVGDGVTDDTAAIQLAFDSVAIDSVDRLVMGVGPYLISDTIEIGGVLANTVVASSSSGLLLTFRHNFSNLTKVQFSTTGTLPTGLSPSTNYWLIKVSATTARVATSLANAEAATAIAYTDAGTGVHTMSYVDQYLKKFVFEGQVDGTSIAPGSATIYWNGTDHTGSSASMTTSGANDLGSADATQGGLQWNYFTVTGLTGVTPAWVGKLLQLKKAATRAHNARNMIVEYISSTSVRIAVMNSALTTDANNGAIQWRLLRPAFKVSTRGCIFRNFQLQPNTSGRALDSIFWVCHPEHGNGFTVTRNIYQNILGLDANNSHIDRFMVLGSLSLPDNSAHPYYVEDSANGHLRPASMYQQDYQWLYDCALQGNGGAYGYEGCFLSCPNTSQQVRSIYVEQCGTNARQHFYSDMGDFGGEQDVPVWDGATGSAGVVFNQCTGAQISESQFFLSGTQAYGIEVYDFDSEGYCRILDVRNVTGSQTPIKFVGGYYLPGSGGVPEYAADAAGMLSIKGTCQVTFKNVHLWYQESPFVKRNTMTASDSSGDLLLTYTDDFASFTKVQFSFSPYTEALPGGLSTFTDYWLVRVSATTAKVATSRARAEAGLVLPWVNAGTGTQYITRAVQFVDVATANETWLSFEACVLPSERQFYLDSGDWHRIFKSGVQNCHITLKDCQKYSNGDAKFVTVPDQRLVIGGYDAVPVGDPKTRVLMGGMSNSLFTASNFATTLTFSGTETVKAWPFAYPEQDENFAGHYYEVVCTPISYTGSPASTFARVRPGTGKARRGAVIEMPTAPGAGATVTFFCMLVRHNAAALTAFHPLQIAGLTHWYDADYDWNYGIFPNKQLQDAGPGDTRFGLGYWRSQATTRGLDGNRSVYDLQPNSSDETRRPATREIDAGYNNKYVIRGDTTDLMTAQHTASYPMTGTPCWCLIAGHPGGGAGNKTPSQLYAAVAYPDFAYVRAAGTTNVTVHCNGTEFSYAYNWNAKEVVLAVFDGASSALYISAKTAVATGSTTALAASGSGYTMAFNNVLVNEPWAGSSGTNALKHVMWGSGTLTTAEKDGLLDWVGADVGKSIGA